MTLKRIATVALSATVLVLAGCRPSGSFEGDWIMDKEASTDTEWRQITLTVHVSDDAVFVRRQFNAGRYNRADSTSFPTDGTPAQIARQASAKWLENVHLGVFIGDDAIETVSAEWTEPGRRLLTSSTLPLTTSTGTTNVVTESTYELARDGRTLIVSQNRQTREEPVLFVYRRATDS